MKLLHESILRTYVGKKLLFALAGIVLVCAFGGYHSSHAISVEKSEWFDYAGALVTTFWYNHIGLFCSIFLFWIAVFVLNVAQPAYNAVTNYREIISHRDVEHFRRFRLIMRTLGVALLFCVIAFFPIIWPRGIAFQYFASVFGAAAFALTVLSSLGLVGKGFGDYRALLRFDFRRCTFDVASLAPVSRQTKHAIRRSVAALDIPQLLKNLELLLGVPNDSVRLHTNTTSAYDHAFREMHLNGFHGVPAVVLSSDAEYPNIIKILESYETPSNNRPVRLLRAEIRHTLWQNVSDEAIVEAYVRKARENAGKVDVIALCHVHHATGRVFPVMDIVGGLEQAGLWSGEEGYLLIDGAQAVGNVFVRKKIWDKCDFYAFCGHKWLLGSPTLGGLYTKRHPRGLHKWEEVPLPAGLSRSCDPNESYGSTAVTDARISLQASIKEFMSVGLERVDRWNSDLANLFREKLPLAETGVSPIRVTQGGIVTVVGDQERIQRMANHVMNRYGRITRFDDAVGPGGQKAALRFSFHCFHSRVDIYELVQHLSEAC